MREQITQATLGTIHWLSMATDTPQQTLRNWIRAGLLVCAKDSSGRNLFDLTSADEVRAIKRAKRRRGARGAGRGRRKKALGN